MEKTPVSDFNGSVEYLYSLQKLGIKLGLNKIKEILFKLGNPHHDLRCIHVAGTNGKGSTSAMLAGVLTAHGYRTGLYTSPHLVRFTERYRIDGAEVSSERLATVFERVRHVVDDISPPTFFEAATAMAFLYFAEEGVDWAVIETGMGGRLDATNVIRPVVSCITNIAHDHGEYLGATLTGIAREKAGIIKDGVPVVTGERGPGTLGVFKTACLRHDAPLFRLGKDFNVRRRKSSEFRYFGLDAERILPVPGLVGAHQLENAALALASLELVARSGMMNIDSRALSDGLAATHWPARLEVLSREPLVVLDGAHNVRGAEILRSALKGCFSWRRLHLVLGIMADKDVEGILRRLVPLAATVVFTRPKNDRAADPRLLDRLSEELVGERYVVPDVAAALALAKSLAGPEDCICIAGSLYLAGEVKELSGEQAV